MDDYQIREEQKGIKWITVKYGRKNIWFSITRDWFIFHI